MIPEDRFSRLAALRAAAKQGRDPTAADETLALLLEEANRVSAHKILEIGAGEGLTSIALFLYLGAEITAIECDPVRAETARRNIAEFDARVRLHEGDAAEILPLLDAKFDLIFLDGPKVQYKRYFPDCKRLLRGGGTLVSDDVLLFGWVRGEPPKKRRMLAQHLREYLGILQNDPDFDTVLYEYGEGVAVSRKKR